MQVNLDEIMKSSEPWELSLSFGGQTHVVRELSDMEVTAARETPADPESQRRFLDGMFAAPKPQLDQWSDEAILTALLAIITYWSERKKTQANHVQSQVAGGFSNHRRSAGPSGK